MMWRGIDGTEVLTRLITTLGVSQPIKDYFTTYNGMLHPDAIMEDGCVTRIRTSITIS